MQPGRIMNSTVGELGGAVVKNPPANAGDPRDVWK